MSDESQPSPALFAQIEAAETNVLSTTEEAREEIVVEQELEKLWLARDNRSLRKMIALCVGAALAMEILLLFTMVFLQGLGHIPFRSAPFLLERWTFNIFTSAVLLQTFGLAHLIVRNLFPASAEERKRSAKKSAARHD